MPFTNPLASLFKKSPFKPVQEHMKLVSECAGLIEAFFDAVLEGNRKQMRELKAKIFELEEKADEVKREIRTHLPKTLFLPVDRRDLLDLLRAQDSIADRAQDIAGLLALAEVEIPEEIRDRLMPYVRLNEEAVRRCRAIVERLDELLELGFRGKIVEHIEEMVRSLSEMETETDSLEMELTGILLKNSSEVDVASFVIWYDVIRLLGDIADNAENVGDRLRLMVAR